MTKITLNKLVKIINKENEPPESWTPEAKEGARCNISLKYLNLPDFCILKVEDPKSFFCGLYVYFIIICPCFYLTCF